jgi:16S rRNA (guanine527-N7)-methyltransferase
VSRVEVRARLVGLADTYRLPPGTAGRLEALLRVLASDPAAPTTVRDPAAAVDVHIADSLAGLELEEVRAAQTAADLGAGAGFPGLVLAAALPDAQWSLVESVGRKCAFIRRAAAASGIAVEVVHARAEAWPAGVGRNDLVTTRALASLSVLVEYAAPLLREGGALVAWKGRRDAAEEAAGIAAAGIVGLEARDVIPVAPYEGSISLHLHLYLKVRSTPNRFPRRPGMAAKRPLA